MTADSALRSAPAERGAAPDDRAGPAFALTFDADSVHLMEREADAWVWRGAARFDAADLAGRMAALRRLLPPEAAGKAALIIPEDQILYTSVEVDPGLPRAEAVLRAVDGLTPYAVEELALDWRDEGDGRVRVAAVWRQTLAEAEAFAARNGFVPAALLADTDGRELPGGVHFKGGVNAVPPSGSPEAGVKGDEGGQSLAAELARTRPGAEPRHAGAEDVGAEPAAPVDTDVGAVVPPDAKAEPSAPSTKADAVTAPMDTGPADEEATGDVAASIARIRALSRRAPAEADASPAPPEAQAPVAPRLQGTEAQRDLVRDRGKALGRQAERQVPPARTKAVAAPVAGRALGAAGGEGLSRPSAGAALASPPLPPSVRAGGAAPPVIPAQPVTNEAGPITAEAGAAAQPSAAQAYPPDPPGGLAGRPARGARVRPHGHGGLAVMLALLAVGLLAVFLIGGGEAEPPVAAPVAETTAIAPVQPAATPPAAKDEAAPAEVQPASPAPTGSTASQPAPATPAPGAAPPAATQPAPAPGLPQPPVPAQATVPPSALPPIGPLLTEPQAAPPPTVVPEAAAPQQRASAIESALAEAVATEPAQALEETEAAPAPEQPAPAPEPAATPSVAPASTAPQIPADTAQTRAPLSSARPIARPARQAPADSTADGRPQASEPPARSPRPPAPQGQRGAATPSAAPAAAPPPAATGTGDAAPPAPRPAAAPEAAAPAPPPAAATPSPSRRPAPRPRQDAALLPSHPGQPPVSGGVRLALAGELTPATAADLRAFPVLPAAAARGALRIHGPSEAALLRFADAAAPLRLAQSRPPRRAAAAPASRSDAVEAALGAAVAAAPTAATAGAAPLRGSSQRPLRRPGGAGAPAAGLLSAKAVEGAIAAAIEASPAPPGGIALSALRSSPLPPRSARGESAPAPDTAAEAAAAAVAAAAPARSVVPSAPEVAAPDAQSAAAQAERRRLDDELQAAVEARIRARAAADAKLEAQQRAAAEARARAQAAAEERAAVARRQPVRPAEIDDEPELAAAPSGGATTAAVAQNATHARGMNLNRTTLIGVVGAGPASRGLIRLRNGRIVTVRLGDRIDGGTITSIGNGRITYVKSGRPFELLMLDGR